MRRMYSYFMIGFIRVSYVFFFILFYPLYALNKWDYKKQMKKNPRYVSWYVRLAEQHPFLYDVGTFFLNYPMPTKVYDILPPLWGRVLQVGCGTGLLNKHQRRGTHIEWINMDVNEHALQYGLKKKRFKDVLHAGIYDVPLEDKSVDIIIFARCFHHIRNQKKTFRECERLLKDGGKIIVTDPIILENKEVVKHMSSGYMVNSSIDGVIWRFTEEAMKKRIQKSLPHGLIMTKMTSHRQLHMSNYNLRYPQTDALVIIEKNPIGEGRESDISHIS